MERLPPLYPCLFRYQAVDLHGSKGIYKPSALNPKPLNTCTLLSAPGGSRHEPGVEGSEGSMARAVAAPSHGTFERGFL